MSTKLAIRITAEDVNKSQLHGEAIVDGLDEATCGVGFDPFRHLRDDHPALAKWDALTSEAMKSIAPQVEEMAIEAIRSRLPFEWDEERDS